MTPIKFLKKVWSLQAKRGYYFCISTKKYSSGRWQDHFLGWPIKAIEIKRLLAKFSDSEYHLYFCPLPFRKPKRDRELVTGSRLLWADLDESNPRSIDPVPQIAWQSSPGRYSALWILSEFHTATEIEPVNKAMTYNVKADKAGWDLTQVLRIPGTRNLKYKKKPRGKLLWFKDNIYDISDIPSHTETLDSSDVLKRLKKKIGRATLRLLTAKHATQGKRSDILWRLENELAGRGLSADEIYALIQASVWNKFRGRRDEERQLRREIGKACDRQQEPDEEPRGNNVTHYGRGLIRMRDVKAEIVSWVWYPYIPRGKVTLIEGDPGLGKSWLTLAIATCISLRKRLPQQQRAIGGNVLLMSAEDGLADTIRPRLDQMSADVKKVYAYPDPIVLDEDGIEEIEEQITELRPTLVVIDPLVAYMGSDLDLHKANQTRTLMAALGRLAEQYNVAIIAIRHLTKGSRDKSIYRGLGSIDLTGAARSVLMIGRDPEDDNGRVLIHIKCNLAPLGPAIGYELRPGVRKPFKWLGKSNLTVADILEAKAEGSGHSERQIAEEFVAETLERGIISHDELIRDSEARGIHKTAIRKACKTLKAKKVRKRGEWYWVNK